MNGTQCEHAQNEIGSVRPPEEWDAGAALPSRGRQAKARTGSLSKKDQGRYENSQTPDKVMQGSEDRLDSLTNQIAQVKSKHTEVQAVIGILNSPIPTLTSMEIPLAPLRKFLLGIADFFTETGYDGLYTSWTRPEYIARRIIGKIRKEADVGGIPDPVILDGLRRIAVDKFQARAQVYHSQIQKLESAWSTAKQQIVSEQTMRAERILEAYNKIKQNPDSAASSAYVELEQSIIGSVWNRRSLPNSKAFRNAMQASGGASKYYVAGLIFQAEDPYQMCCKVRRAFNEAKNYSLENASEYIDEELFPLALRLHTISLIESRQKRELYLELLEIELKTFEEGLRPRS